MRAETKLLNIKPILLFLALCCIVIIFGMNKVIVNQLRNEARIQVELLAKSYSDAINSSNQDDIRFVMDVLLPSIHFPIIITTKDEISAVLNLSITQKEGSKEYNSIAWKIVEEMDENFPPLDLVWNDVKWGKIHFSDPQVVTHLRWMPYLEVGFGIILITIAIWGFQLIRRSEMNYIYAGMARETAHQLGTPVSSLMGWVNLMREENNHNSLILNSVEEDISRLSEISEKFSKIGSKPKLIDLNLDKLILEVIEYIKNRIPQNSDIKINYFCDQKIIIKGDWILMRWAMDNLMKNALDAIDKGNGDISVFIQKNIKSIKIDIVDSGKGISRTEWKKIFKPGYSSKKRGWGLGLSLTQRIIEQIHGGNVRVVSSKYGKTILRIDLPL